MTIDDWESGIGSWEEVNRAFGYCNLKLTF